MLDEVSKVPETVERFLFSTSLLRRVGEMRSSWVGDIVDDDDDDEQGMQGKMRV